MSLASLLIVADVHHGARGVDVGPDFRRFLASAPDLGDALLVNGDLFDFWYGWRSGVPGESLAVLEALGRLAERMPVHLVGGNHDRWGDDYWPAQFGLQWHREAVELEVGGRRVHCRHGDGLAYDGPVNRALHQVVALPVLHRAIGLVPPALTIGAVRTLGLGLDFRTAFDPVRLDRQEARQRRAAEAWLLAHPQIDWLVLAHTHRRADGTAPNGRRWCNPGPFAQERRYALLTGDGVRFEQLADA